MKKLIIFTISFCALFCFIFTSCDLNSGGISYFQVYNNSDRNISLHLYFNNSLFYNDTVIYLGNKKSSDVFTHEDAGAGISRVMILMSADSIDFLEGDNLLKRYRPLDSRYLKTPFSKEFYDSTYVNNNRKTVCVYTIESDDFE